MQRTFVARYNALDLDSAIDQIYGNLKASNQRSDLGLAMDCYESSYALSTNRPQASIGGKKVYCSLVVALWNARQAYPEYELRECEEGSHFVCHNPLCVRKEHLILESGRVNKSRLCCRLYGHLDWYRCPHLPRCTTCPATRLSLL
jgi:hypothetical protein